MTSSKARTVAVGGLLLALGVLFPQVFHLVGGPAAGGVWLPMHIPVLLGGFFLGPWWGLALGVITPCLSAFTGMPSLVRLPFMVCELAAYGFFAGLTTRRFKLPVWAGLPLAQLAGRLIYALALFVAGSLLHLGAFSAVAAWTATVAGLPGIVLQWILVPLLLLAARKAGWMQRDGL